MRKILDGTQEIIVTSEDNPQSPAGYSYTVTLNFSEKIRKAVNEYYGIDSENYLTVSSE